MNKKNKAIFLDRDGTINIDKDYLCKIEEFEFIDGVKDFLKRVQALDYKLIIITNQSGIGRGYYSENDFNILNNWMINTLKEDGITIDKVYYCPHYKESNIKKYAIDCECRKPKLQLFEKAVTDFNLDLSKCFAIGDKIRDCLICTKSDCKGILINNNENKDIINNVKKGKVKNVVYCKTIKCCYDIIVKGGI